MLKSKPFACILLDGKKIGFSRLLDAIEESNRMRAAGLKHRLLAMDSLGEMVDVGKLWIPDCACESTDDVYGGIVNNQWEEKK